jgi:glutamate 5-kinase
MHETTMNRPAATRSALPSLRQFRRIVVKVGSSLLVDRERGRLKHAWLAALAEDIGNLHAGGADVIVVSSGAIALGRTVLDMPKGVLKLEESQAAAAVGQIALARSWAEALGHQGITTGQILVTLGDTEERLARIEAMLKGLDRPGQGVLRHLHTLHPPAMQQEPLHFIEEGEQPFMDELTA